MNDTFIIETFENQEITFDFLEHDMMVNATEMAQSFNKRLDVFLKAAKTQAYIKALVKSKPFNDKTQSNYHQMVVVEQDYTNNKLDNMVIETREGNYGGTYMCQDLAIYFAMWLSPEFAVWVTQTIRKLLWGSDPVKTRKALTNIPRLFQETKELNNQSSKLRKRSVSPEIIETRKLVKFKLINVETRIKAIIDNAGQRDLFETPEEIGRRMIKLSQEKIAYEKEIAELNKMEQAALSFEEYIDLQKDINKKKEEMSRYIKDIRSN